MHPKLAKIAEPKAGEKWEIDDAALYRLDNGNWCVSECHSWIPGVYESAVSAWFATILKPDVLQRVLDNTDRVVTLEDLVVEFVEDCEEIEYEDRGEDE